MTNGGGGGSAPVKTTTAPTEEKPAQGDEASKAPHGDGARSGR